MPTFLIHHKHTDLFTAQADYLHFSYFSPEEQLHSFQNYSANRNNPHMVMSLSAPTGDPLTSHCHLIHR